MKKGRGAALGEVTVGTLTKVAAGRAFNSAPQRSRDTLSLNFGSVQNGNEVVKGGASVWRSGAVIRLKIEMKIAL